MQKIQKFQWVVILDVLVDVLDFVQMDVEVVVWKLVDMNALKHANMNAMKDANLSVPMLVNGNP